MRKALRLHPQSRCTAATRIDAEVARPRPCSLVLRYVVTGAVRDLRLPPPMAPVRADGLWRHTCFEAFLRAAPGDAYYEFNFAPSREWAAYRFDAYRAGMSVAQEVRAPRIDLRATDEVCELHASLDLDGVAGVPGDAAWRLALSAVVEEASGDKSYWALAHPPGRADFHHPDGFACELPAVARP